MAGWRTHLVTLLPVAALAIVPLAGLVYVAFASPPVPRAPAPAPQGSNITARIPAAELPESPFVSEPKTRQATPQPGALVQPAAPPTDPAARDAARHLCCEKLTDLAQRAEVSVRATFQAASAACNAAPDLASAQAQVAAIILGSGAAMPTECQRKG